MILGGSTGNLGTRTFILLALAGACLLGMPREARTAGTPKRVVSMNLCTDQLAMMLAGPGQLISVSHLARDRAASVMASEAAHIPINYGQAEEIFLLKPDLVIAGTYTTRTTVALLRRLGFRVEAFAPANSLDEVRENIVRMGAVLNRTQAASRLRSEFDQMIAARRVPDTSLRPAIAPYYANSYTSGRDTLVDAIITASGLTNLGRKLGLRGTAKLPMERLLVEQPEMIMLEQGRSGKPALAHEIFKHPAVKHLVAHSTPVAVPDKYLICGTPHIARAVEVLWAARNNYLRGKGK